MGLPYAEPLGFLAFRFAIAALILGILMFSIPGIRPDSLTLAECGHSAVVGILIQAVYLGGVFSAISIGISAGLSALIVGLQPLLTVILATIWLRERITVIKMVGIFLGLLGLILVITERGNLDGSLSIQGLLLCVAALLGITVGSLYQKRFCTEVSMLPAVAIQYIASVIVLLPLALATETLQFDWTPTFIVSLTWLILVLSLGAVFMLLWLIRQGEAGTVATLFYLVPPVVALEAWILFEEKLSLLLFTGILLCIAGVALVMRSPVNSSTSTSTTE